MKKIGIGYEDYRNFVDEDMYYIDKTLLVRDVLEKGGVVTLFTRPRRFGKTLALSMLRTFFELEYDREGKPIDKHRYFEGKKIMDCGEDVLSRMGQYPVIKLSLKGAKFPDFERCFLMLRDGIIDEFSRHRYVLTSGALDEEAAEEFRRLLRGAIEWRDRETSLGYGKEREAAIRQESGRYARSLRVLSECLEKYHGKKAIILLDEYDVPLENAYFNGFYDEMIAFIRSLFEETLKTNDALSFAVVTGCLRISKESIFTGLNHLDIYSIRSTELSEYFGFTQEETDEMLRAYGLTDKREEVRQWYDGYLFGETEVYNPWSVIKYVKTHVASHDWLPEPYWANTSSNEIIRDLIGHADEGTRRELDLLIQGGTIEKQIHEDITYGDIDLERERAGQGRQESDKPRDNLWNFLFFTGYLKKISERREGRDVYATMRIPNEEVAYIYENQMTEWFKRLVRRTSMTDFYQAIRDRDHAALGKQLTALLKKSISTYDSRESFYHGFFLSILMGMPDYEARSNREAGEGRPDIILYPEDAEAPAYIFELKVRRKFSEMRAGLEEALSQIRERHYEEGVLEDGYIGAVSFGVCFCKKSCVVGGVDEES